MAVIFFLVLLAAALVVGYGFTTSQQTFLADVTPVLGQRPAPASSTPSIGAFISVITLFMFAYGGLTAATSLGGEARDATRSMPRGILGGWLTALILYGLVALALFHAVPWWTVQPLVASKHSELATTPGLIGMVAPRAVAVFVNFLVMIIVGKTIAPEMLDCSRYLFAWAQDGLLPKAFMHTARSKAPDVALLISAVLGSLFLIEATFAGWQIGVILRSISLVLVFGVVGIGALNVRYNRRFRDTTWGRELARHADIVVFGVLAIVVAIVLLQSVAVVPKTSFIFQPSVQGVIAIIIAALIYLAAARGARRQGIDLAARAREHVPVE